MDNIIEEYPKRPVRYQYIDGIYEICCGLLLLGMVLLSHLWLAMLTVIIVCGQIVIKKKVIYPRTGYVRLRGVGIKPWIWGIISAAIALVAVFAFRRFSYSLTVLLASAGWAFIYAYMGRLARMDNIWRWLAVLAMILGPTGISLLPLDRQKIDALGIGFIALIFLTSGSIVFLLYLRRTRSPEQVVE